MTATIDLKHLERVVATHGYALVTAQPDAGDVAPPFAYTVGLYRSFGHAELLVSGLPPAEACFVLERVAMGVREGACYGDTTPDDAVLPGEQVRLVTLPSAHPYPVLVLSAFYRARVPTLQVFHPDADGLWPWQRPADDPWRAAATFGHPSLERH